MGEFFYANRTLPVALVRFAQLFDAIGIICHSDTCHGQQDRWHDAWNDTRLTVVDSAKVRDSFPLQCNNVPRAAMPSRGEQHVYTLRVDTC